MADSTRARIIASAMRLFGSKGFAATSVAQIEGAAGLKPGSGGLYRHFTSKEQLLEIAMRERIEARDDLMRSMSVAEGTAMDAVLDRVARAGLARLDDERDISRILVRDLDTSPALLELFRDAELRTNHRALTNLLTQFGGDEADAEAVAAILIDSISHYWLLRDIYGGAYPLEVSEDRYVKALVAMATRLMGAK